MKRFVLLFFVFGLFASTACMAQCYQGISTDPANPVNPERPDLENTFNWMQKSFDINSPYYPAGSFIGSPFFENSGFLGHLSNHPVDELDFYPEDGWELVKRDFGYLLDGEPKPGSVTPYLILYNKHSATLRIFAAIPGHLTPYDSVRIHLAFEEFNSGVSALLGASQALAQPLSHKSKTREVIGASLYPNSQYRFFYADFPVAYDPCLCFFRSALSVEFELVEYFMVNGTLLSESVDLAGFVFSTPGSHYPAPDRRTEKTYPLYNELLGLFATPALPRVVGYQEYEPAQYTRIEDGATAFGYRRKVAYKVADSFEYMLNPAAQIDLGQTEIEAALIIKQKKQTNQQIKTTNLQRVGEIDNVGTLFYYHLETGIDEVPDTVVYKTPYVPVQCLNKLFPVIESAFPAPTEISPLYEEVFLSLKINYTFKTTGKDGQRNRFTQTLTYPLEVNYLEEDVITTAEGYVELPEHLTVGAAHYPRDTVIKAWSTIAIAGAQTAEPGVVVEFVAGNGISVEHGASLQPGMILQQKVSVACGSSGIPMSQGQVAAFCRSSEYQANQLADNLPEDEENEHEESWEKPDVLVRPNPATDFVDVTILDYQGLRNNSEVFLSLTDLNGKVIISKSIPSPRFERQFSEQLALGQLAPGMYLLKVRFGIHESTHKVMKVVR